MEYIIDIKFNNEENRKIFDRTVHTLNCQLQRLKNSKQINSETKVIINYDEMRISIKPFHSLNLVPFLSFINEENIHTTDEFDISNQVELTITFDNSMDTELVANITHSQLVGIQDYIDSKILLSYEATEKANYVAVVIGSESDYLLNLDFISKDFFKTEDKNRIKLNRIL